MRYVTPLADPLTAERIAAPPAGGRGAASPGEESLRLLVEAHGRSMLRLARSIVAGDPHLAEDIVQESLIKVWRGLHTYRGEAPIEHWIMRITHNTAVSALRARREDPRGIRENCRSERSCPPSAQQWDAKISGR